MKKRVNYHSVAPKAIEMLLTQETYLQEQFRHSESIGVITWELVKLRISQINKCAFCIDMHSKDALWLGERQERVIGLDAWRDMPFYSKNERLALEFAEIVISDDSVEWELYQSMLDSFGERALVDLTIAINAINSWNKLSKVFKPEAGKYKVKAVHSN